MSRLLLALAVLAACDSSSKTPPPVEAKPAETKPAAPAPAAGDRDERNVGAYTAVRVTGPFTVVLVRGELLPVVVEAPPAWTPRVLTTVEGDTLVIRLADGSPSDVPAIRVDVPSEKADDISLTGSGAVYSAVPILGAKIRLALSGSGTMQIDTSGQAVVAELTGSGSMKLTGATPRLDAKLTGSGSLDAAGLTAKDASIDSTGSGGVEVNVIQTLTCNLTGAGSLGYVPAMKLDVSQCRSTGSGRVERRKF
jgi:hypothetical protein